MPTCAKVENKAVNNLISANRKEFNSRLFSSISRMRIVLIEDFCELLISLQPKRVCIMHSYIKYLSSMAGWLKMQKYIARMQILDSWTAAPSTLVVVYRF